MRGFQMGEEDKRGMEDDSRKSEYECFHNKVTVTLYNEIIPIYKCNILSS